VISHLSGCLGGGQVMTFVVLGRTLVTTPATAGTTVA
jgi:hypothetical protein